MFGCAKNAVCDQCIRIAPIRFQASSNVVRFLVQRVNTPLLHCTCKGKYLANPQKQSSVYLHYCSHDKLLRSWEYVYKACISSSK